MIISLLGGGRKWTYKQILKDKSLRLLLPGLVFSLVAFALKLSFPGEMTRQAGISLHDIIHQYFYPNDNPLRELWFIVTLFWLFLLTPVWNTVIMRRWSLGITMVILIVLHFYHPDNQFLCIDRLCRYGVWFYMGIVISQNGLTERIIQRKWFTLILGSFIYIIGYFSNEFITTIGGIVISFVLALILDEYIPKTFFTFRNYTYQIFLMGIFAQIMIKIVYRHVEMSYFMAFLLCIIAGLYIPVLVSKAIERINWKPLMLCVGLKKRNN